MSSAEGLKDARQADLDLVEVAPNSSPPVCRIMDYAKYKYDQEKKLKEARKKQKVIHVKEIKFHPHISEHDYCFKRQHVEKFIKRGDRVKATMVYRGRELRHKDTGHKVLQRLAQELVAIAAIEKPPAAEGRSLIMVLTPKG